METKVFFQAIFFGDVDSLHSFTRIQSDVLHLSCVEAKIMKDFKPESIGNCHQNHVGI